MDFRILGPLEVHDEGNVVPVGGAKPRALLAALLLRANEGVSSERLIDELWGEEPPDTAPNALQVYVSQLRKALGADVVKRRGAGYALEIDRADLDLARFEDLVAEARTLPPAAASDRLRAALSLWRGEPEADAHRLEELRVAALEDRIDADLELGRHAEVIPELQALVEAEPLRERPRAQLMLALYREGRQAEALAEYARARETLVDELGVEPGPELQRLQRAILAQDPTLVGPARAAAVPESRLPAPPTPLVGRERELAEAAQMFRSGVRLVTLTGPGGIGKTRLALELARQLEPELPDGAVLVRLATVLDPALVPDAFAQAVGVPDADADALRDHLRTRSLLVLLDNFEQLLPAAPFLSELLEAASRLRLLVTSRAVLRIAGEQEYPVPPLDEAEELFAARARAVQPAFVPDPAVTEICARLDRLPLAIELAAARVKLLPPRAILERLGHSLDLLTGGRTDVPAHQQTLRAAIEWSYRLLDEDEQSLFARLSVFAGGATLDAIEEICGGDLDTLGSLVDNSLLRSSGDRFTMLELLREFAAEQLGGDDDLRRTHADFYVALAEEAAAATDEAAKPQWFDRLEQEHGNLRAAFAFAVEQRDAATAVRLAAGLTRFWQIHGHLVEARTSYETALALDGDVPLLARQKATNGLGIMLAEQGDFDGAEPLFTRAVELARELNDETRIAIGYSNLGNLFLFRRDYEGARKLFAQALDGYVAAGHARGHAITTENLGIVAFCEGHLDEAEELLTRAFTLAEDIGDQREQAAATRSLARIALERGLIDEADAILGRGIPPARAVGDRHGLADAVEVAAGVAAARGDGGRAAQLYGAAESLREAIGATRQPDLADWHERVRADAERLLEPAAFAAALEAGRGLDLDGALAVANAANAITNANPTD
ncbi:MAG TPA: BTAD domain-containing putative transcriptional regulator [Gaiellaceae bacterium]